MSEEQTLDEKVEQIESGMMSDHDPLEVAAMMMRNFAPRYKNALGDLSTGQLRRLALALATYPLEYEDVLGVDDKLSQVFSMGDKLLQAKTLMIQDAIFKEVEAQQKKENENGEV